MTTSSRHFGVYLVIASALVFTFLFVSQDQWITEVPKNIASVHKSKQIFLSEIETLNVSLMVTSNMTSVPLATSLSPRNMVGQWIGNTWIPPQPWRYYSPAELRELYKDKTILWMGDSLGRRSFASMYNILNSTHSNHTSVESITKASIIDFNKYKQVEFCPKWQHLPRFHPDACRPMPGNDATGEFIKMKMLCFSHIKQFLLDELEGKSNLTSSVELVVLVLGIWDVVIKSQCGNYTTRKKPLKRLKDLIKVAARFTVKTGKRIVWRTSGFKNETSQIQSVHACNDLIMNTIDRYHEHGSGEEEVPNLTYINWGRAVEDRSFFGERIAGDTNLHYGPEPRVVLVQMLTNHLHDLGWFL